MTPHGALSRVIKRLNAIGKTGDRADLDAYIASAEFTTMQRLLLPTSFPSVAAAHAQAMQAILARHVPLQPGPHRGRWSAEMVERLRLSWQRHKGNAYRVGRDLSITEDAAARAHKRFIVAGATPSPRKPPKFAQGRQGDFQTASPGLRADAFAAAAEART